MGGGVAEGVDGAAGRDDPVGLPPDAAGRIGQRQSSEGRDHLIGGQDVPGRGGADPGKEKAPVSGPRSPGTKGAPSAGVFAPWSKVGLLGDCPRASRAWITSAVDFGSVVWGWRSYSGSTAIRHRRPGGRQEPRPSSTPVGQSALRSQALDRVRRCVRVLFGTKLPRIRSHGALTLSGLVHPPSAHCWFWSHDRRRYRPSACRLASAARASPWSSVPAFKSSYWVSVPNRPALGPVVCSVASRRATRLVPPKLDGLAPRACAARMNSPAAPDRHCSARDIGRCVRLEVRQSGPGTGGSMPVAPRPIPPAPGVTVGVPGVTSSMVPSGPVDPRPTWRPLRRGDRGLRQHRRGGAGRWRERGHGGEPSTVARTRAENPARCGGRCARFSLPGPRPGKLRAHGVTPSPDLVSRRWELS